MYLQKVISKKIRKLFFVGVLKVADAKEQDPEQDPDQLVNARIRIRISTKMARTGKLQ
jgi:hypothetical protein